MNSSTGAMSSALTSLTRWVSPMWEAVVTAAYPQSAMRDTMGSMSRATILARTDLGRSRAVVGVTRMRYLFEGGCGAALRAYGSDGRGGGGLRGRRGGELHLAQQLG